MSRPLGILSSCIRLQEKFGSEVPLGDRFHDFACVLRGQTAGAGDPFTYVCLLPPSIRNQRRGMSRMGENSSLGESEFKNAWRRGVPALRQPLFGSACTRQGHTSHLIMHILALPRKISFAIPIRHSSHVSQNSTNSHKQGP